MKLTCILILAACIQVKATAYAQNITLSVKNTPLEEVFKAIEKQSGLVFFYEQTCLEKTNNRINLEVKNLPLVKALDLCFKDQPLTYTIVGETIVVKLKENFIRLPGFLVNIDSSTIRIAGKVLNENGEGLAGATVQVRGTNYVIGVGSGGAFSIVIPGTEGLLVVSYVGYKTKEVSVSGADVDLTIRLERVVVALKDVTVVSTGYQILPKERATGSFEKVNNELFNRTTGPTVLARLEGIVPGLLFDKRVLSGDAPGLNQLTIRGQSTLESNKNPLIVLDNFPYEGDVRNINPNDVENITVLKDAAAASIWGVRAGNGVIVITTKKGSYDKPMQVSFNANAAIAEKPDLFYLPQMNPVDYINVERFLFSKGHYDNLLSDRFTYPLLSPVVEILNQQKTGVINATTANAKIEALSQYDTRNEFLKYVYRNSADQQYAINVNGGSNTLSYIVTAGYDRSISNTVKKDNNRIILRTNLSFKPIKNLEIQFGTIYTKSKYNSPGTPDRLFYRTDLLPYTCLADGDGTPLVVGRDYRVGFVDTAGKGRLLDWKYRPLAELNASSNVITANDQLLNLGARYKINNIFSAEVKYQYGRTHSETRNWQGRDAYYTRNLVNLYTQPVGSQVERPIPLGGVVSVNNDNFNTHALRGQLNADKSWGTSHSLAAIAGAELRENHALSSGFNAYGYDDKILTYQGVSFNVPYPLYLPLGSAVIPQELSFSDQTYRFTSLYANAAYTYKSRYTISASGRKDASNLFGVKPNKRGTPLWSAGVAWNISQEPFYRFDLIQDIKLRATFGYNGNTNNNLSAYSVIQYRGAAPFTSLNNAIIQNPRNEGLGWEKVGIMNLGIDFVSRNNRLSGSIEYYTKRSVDVIYIIPIGLSTGFNSMKVNAVNMKAKGVDLSLHSSNLGNSQIKWNTDLIFSYNENRITKYLPLGTPSASNFVSTAQTLISIVGKPLNAIYSYKWAGLDPLTGDPQGYDDKGEISKNYTALNATKVEDLEYNGTALPIFYGGLRNTFSWKNISLSANVTYKFKYYIRRPSIHYDMLFYSNTGHMDYAKRWQKPGDEKNTDVPSMIYPSNYNRDQFYAGSSTLVSPADHIRLQDITTGYSIEKPLLFMKNIRFYANVSNIGIIWRANKFGLDPDYGLGFPAPRSVAFGLNANF